MFKKIKFKLRYFMLLLVFGLGINIPSMAQDAEIMEEVAPGFWENLMSTDPLLLMVLKRAVTAHI